MFRCKIVHLLFKILPIKIYQDLLIRHHIQNCSSCQKELASVAETKPFLIQEGELDVPESLWPAIKARISQEKIKRRVLLPLRWRWAAVAGLAVIITLGVWLLFVISPIKKPVEESLVERFQIKYIKVQDTPAKVYLYTLQEPKMVFIWAEKNS